MTNEIIINDLKISINKINSCLVGISKNYLTIGELLYKIKRDESIEKTNFKEYKNISEFAEAEFGFDKTKTYNLIAIYEKFFLNKPVGFFNNYKFGQLREMLPMTEDQLRLCNENMTVKEIIAAKSYFSARAEEESIANTELIKNNNVIEGVFPEKSIEDLPEEKVTTIIVTELPREPIKENKTITVDVKTSQNDDCVTKQEIIPEVQEDYYKKKYHEALEEINVRQENIVNESKKTQHYKNKCQEQQEVLKYVSDKLNKICTDLYNDQIQYLYAETRNYIDNGLLPKKVHFMKNVI